MSTQYDSIQGPYDLIRKSTISLIEHENVKTTVSPFIKNAKVLDLACGSGFYTYNFLEWGANSVVGVDISPAMIKEARRRQGEAVGGFAVKNVNFIEADCSKPTSYEGGPFDLVFGAWLINYAPDRAGLVDMFKNIALNLREGGHCVMLTVPPDEHPPASINAELEVRPGPDWSGGLQYSLIRVVEDGVYFHCHGETELGDVDFDNYHLRKSVIEGAARDSGLQGNLHWRLTEVPERYLKGERPGGSTLKEMETYQTVSNYGLLVIAT